MLSIQITLGGGTGNDYYDVSLVDGFNVPISVEPVDGTGDCKDTACSANLNTDCPDDLKVTGASNDTAVVGCKSACDAFEEPIYCCTGDYGSPSTCGPSNYSQIFKKACPSAYSYAYDDASSVFTCVGAGYVVTFCPWGFNKSMWWFYGWVSWDLVMVILLGVCREAFCIIN